MNAGRSEAEMESTKERIRYRTRGLDGGRMVLNLGFWKEVMSERNSQMREDSVRMMDPAEGGWGSELMPGVMEPP